MKSPVMKPFISCIALICIVTLKLGAQEMSGELDWERMEFNSTITLDLKKAGIKLPAGRAMAESMLEDEFGELIRPFINELQVDSSSTIADLINRGELSYDVFLGKVRGLPPALSPDFLSVFARYSLTLNDISGELIRHSRPGSIAPPLIPVPVKDYTGIIIIADESLPVHGRSTRAFAVPCLFPKIWDSEMNLVFEKNMIDAQRGKEAGLVRYTSRGSVMRQTPSSLDNELIQRVGENPLVIMASGLFGVVPTDPIIAREDALLILSSENNRRLLAEGKIVIVLEKDNLKKTIP